ncbi:unnamed protein product, partial [Enterobius vermicularis]|uniref:Aminopeptidase N n=1 Tax=Enterobius vermicularis TaxID=51028 RepID=A0A0N4VNS7_ENTVE
MENWGLITAAENSVGYNRQLCDARTKLWVADVIAHEIAHMWFGNLATMRWWNDMWINEGFATMMAVKAADFVQNTTIRTNEYFTAEMAYHALRSDSYTEQPMSLKKNSTQVYTINKKILYLKAATVLRMMEATVGDDEFRETLHYYLTKYAYKNADKDEFLNCFSRQYAAKKLRNNTFISKNISLFSFLDSWFYQPGFPLLQVDRSGDKIMVSQKLYNTDDIGNSSETNFQWNVPLFVKTNDPSSILWLRRNESLVLRASRRPVLVDVDTRGYYRINYDENTWKDLIVQLLENHTEISPNARVRLIDDAFTLAGSKIISFEVPLRLGIYLKQELNLSPLSCFFRHFDVLNEKFKVHSKSALFTRFGIFLLEPLYHHYVKTFIPTLQRESDVKIWVQSAVISKICLYGYQPCVQLILPLFKELVQNCTGRMFSDSCNKVQPTVRRVLYAVAAKYGSQEDFETLLQKSRIEKSRFESQRLYSVLGYTQNQSNIYRILEENFNEGADFKINFQLLALARSEAKIKQWLAFMTKNYNSQVDIWK